MKKSLVKLAALSSAAFVLAGTVAPVVLAEEPAQVREETEKAPEKGDNEVGFDSEEAAEAAAKKALETDTLNKSFTVSQNLAGKWIYVLSPAEVETTAPEAPAPEDEKNPRVTIDEYKKIKAPEEAEKLTSKKFETKKEAEDALKAYLDEYKGIIHNSGKVVQEFGGWYVKLSPEVVEETTTPETPKPETPGVPLTPLTPAEELHITEIPFDTEDDAHKAAKKHLETDKVNKSYKIVKGADNKYYVELSTEEAEAPEAPEAEVDGYATREEAEAAAKKALENDPINNAFEVSQGADGRYYYRLFVDSAVAPETPEKPAEPKPEEPKPETPEKDLDTVKAEALARLELLKALTKAEVEHFTKAILNAESANEVAAIIKEAEDVNFSVNLKPETPAKEVKPEEGKKEEAKKEDKKEKLPETGEVSSFAIFGGAALSVLAGLGLVASKKEEN